MEIIKNEPTLETNLKQYSPEILETDEIEETEETPQSPHEVLTERKKRGRPKRNNISIDEPKDVHIYKLFLLFTIYTLIRFLFCRMYVNFSATNAKKYLIRKLT